MSTKTETSCIYALLDPRTCEVRYVGKSQRSLNNRMSLYRRSRSNTPVCKWARRLFSEGNPPTAIRLEESTCGQNKDLADKEKFWIEYLAFLGADLLNRHDNPQRKKRNLYLDRAKRQQDTKQGVATP